ncbi:MAG: flavodoxin domain-containing protein, partial [Pseudomonadota bacterium]
MVETSLYAVSAERWWLSAAIGLLWVLASLYWMGVFRRVRMVTEGVVIAHASQTGTAEHLARVMKGQMDAASINSALLPLAELDEGALAHARKLVLIASTTGEGEAPDGVRHLEKTLLREALSLPHLKVFILALGDRSYDAFCAYGHRLAEWAKASEADVSLITVDHQASEDLARWDALMSANGLAPLSEAHSEGLIPWVVEARDEVASGDQSPI